MTPKRFWMLFTLAGALMFVAGLVLTIVLVVETGTEQPDSACDSSMGATVHTYACYTSDDPKVLLGVAPLMVGIGMGVWGGIKWSSAAARERMGDSSDPNSLLGGIQSLQQQAMGMASGTGTMGTGGAPGGPDAPPGGPPLKS